MVCHWFANCKMQHFCKGRFHCLLIQVWDISDQCTLADEQCFSEAIDHTAAQLADSWFTFVTLNAHVDSEPNNISCFYSRLRPQASVPHRPWQVEDKNKKWFRLVTTHPF